MPLTAARCLKAKWHRAAAIAAALALARRLGVTIIGARHGIMAAQYGGGSMTLNVASWRRRDAVSRAYHQTAWA